MNSVVTGRAVGSFGGAYKMVAILQRADARDEQHNVGGDAASAHCDDLGLPAVAATSSWEV